MAIRLSPLQVFQRDKFFLSSAVRGLGANKTIEAAKKIGLPIRRTDGLALYRNYVGIPAKAERMKYVRKSYRFSQSLYTEQKRHMTRRYRYTMKFETRDKRSGEISEHATSVISDRPMTPLAVESAVSDATKKIIDFSPVEITKVWHHLAEHRKGDAWDI